MLQEKTKAPNFTLPDKDGKEVSLSDFLGKKVVLYFYPKDNTPGCTRQACAFAAAFEEFKKEDVVVIGISKDSVTSHQKFAEKYSLPFILLADTELEVIKAYDVWTGKTLYGKFTFGTERSTYIIDENGYIQKALKKVNPDKNPVEVLEYIRG
jgi:peroxiredoxin Q/BCP